MADLPRMNPGTDTIYAKLQVLPGDSPLNVDAFLGLAGPTPAQSPLLPGGQPADDYLTNIYPTPDLSSTALTVTEWSNFMSWYYTQLYARYSFRDMVYFATKLPQLAILAVDAKYEITGNIGPISNGTLVPSLIRAATCYPTISAADIIAWPYTVATAGWAVGASVTTVQTGAFNINLNTTTSGSILRSPQNRVVMEVLGIGDFASSPRITEWQLLDQTQRKLGVHENPWLHTPFDLRVYEFDQAFLVQLNKALYIDINYETAGASIPTVLGGQIQTTDYATNEAT